MRETICVSSLVRMSTNSHHHSSYADTHDRNRQPWHSLPKGFADYLALEARLSEPVRSAALSQVAMVANAEPSVILDLGSGTGADTVALAQRFPGARVHALDVSEELLQGVAGVVAVAGVADRVERHRSDLDGDWPPEVSSDVDLVWATLSLHHVDEPEAALRKVYAALRPGGLLVLTELTGDQRFKPGDLGSGSDNVRERLEAALSRGQHSNPDWIELLASIGFATVERRDVEVVAHASTEYGAEYLKFALSSHRERLAPDLPDDDAAKLDAVIGSLSGGTSTISSHSARTVWIARRPLADVDSATVNEPEVIDAEVAVLGGGSAGLAAATALGRSRRRVAVVDAGEPRNAPAEGAHNVLGNEGISPLRLVAKGRAEAESYGVQVVQGAATAISGTIDDFTVEVDGGVRRVRARRIILATGLVDDLPDVPGVAEGWGHSVLHCAFCHGWEVRDQRIAILARDEVAVHLAVLFRQLSDDVTVFLHDAPDPTDMQWEQLRTLNVSVVRPRVDRLVVDGTQVRAVETDGGKSFEADAVVVVPRYNARADLYEALGGTGETTQFGLQIPVDVRGATPVAGVWATGSASQPMAMVLASAAAGVTTGTAVHGELAFADLNHTIDQSRSA